MLNLLFSYSSIIVASESLISLNPTNKVSTKLSPKAIPNAVKYHIKDGPMNTGKVVTAGMAKAAALTLKKPAKAPPKPPATQAQTIGRFKRKVTPNTAGSETPSKAISPAEKASVLNTYFYCAPLPPGQHRLERT